MSSPGDGGGGEARAPRLHPSIHGHPPLQMHAARGLHGDRLASDPTRLCSLPCVLEVHARCMSAERCVLNGVRVGKKRRGLGGGI